MKIYVPVTVVYLFFLFFCFRGERKREKISGNGWKLNEKTEFTQEVGDYASCALRGSQGE